MRKLVLLAGLGVALAGCDKGPSTEDSARSSGEIRLENATAEEVMKQAAAAQEKNRMQPGEWENTFQLVSADMPGAPEMLRKKMAEEAKKPPSTTRECRKAEDAKAMDFTKLAPATQGCTFPKYVMANGKVDAKMECKGPFGPVKMTINGTQSPSSYDMTVTTEQTPPGGSAQSKMTIRATGKRLGECKG